MSKKLGNSCLHTGHVSCSPISACASASANRPEICSTSADGQSSANTAVYFSWPSSSSTDSTQRTSSSGAALSGTQLPEQIAASTSAPVGIRKFTRNLASSQQKNS